VARAVLVLLLGWGLLAGAAAIDVGSRLDAPWPGLLFSPESPAPWEGAIPARVRRVPVDNFPLQSEIAYRARSATPRELYRSLGLAKTEWLIAPEIDVEALRPLLASGRLPQPGRPEVLAGAFCRAESIQIEDARFRVVGRMKRGAGGLSNVYLLPGHYVWDGLLMHTATWGWIDPDGRTRLEEAEDPSGIVEEHAIHGRLTPAPVESVFLSFTGLFVVAVAGARLHGIVFGRLGVSRGGPFASTMRLWTSWPRLSGVLHAGLYGGFFLAMVAAIAYPIPNILLQEFIQYTFRDGGLGYVGAAYESGNVAFASAATWVNNYLVQTVGMTILLSILIPFAGVAKAFASFCVAGFGLAPLWTGLPGTLVFHSVTMVFELQAYIFACLAVCIFWAQIVDGLRRGAGVGPAFRSLLMGTLLTGVMLGIAAVYEAVTLIVLK